MFAAVQCLMQQMSVCSTTFVWNAGSLGSCRWETGTACLDEKGECSRMAKWTPRKTRVPRLFPGGFLSI